MSRLPNEEAAWALIDLAHRIYRGEVISACVITLDNLTLQIHQQPNVSGWRMEVLRFCVWLSHKVAPMQTHANLPIQTQKEFS